MLSDPSFPIEQFQHLPNPYPHDAIRDSFLRTNIVNLDLASPPPQRSNPKSHPLTPPDTPERRRHHSEQPQHISEFQKERLEVFFNAGLHVDLKNAPTRYLVVGGIPSDAPAQALTRVFSRMGDLKGMFVRYQKQGIVVLSWHDIRDAKKAQAILISGLFFGAQESLVAAFITPSNLIKATGESPFVDGNEGNLSITAEQQPNSNGQQPVSLHAALALFGELSSFVVNPDMNSTTYLASYYDAREAANAAKAMNGRAILGMLIQVSEGFPRISTTTPGTRFPIIAQESQTQNELENEYKVQSRDIPTPTFHRSHNTIRRTARAISNPSPPPSMLSLNQGPKHRQPEPPAEIMENPEPLSPSSTISANLSGGDRPALNRSQSSSEVDTLSPLKPKTLAPRASFTADPNMQNRSISPSRFIPRTLPPRLSLPWLNAQTHKTPPPYNTPQYIPPYHHYPQMFNPVTGYQMSQLPHVPYPYMPNQSSPGSFQGNTSLPSQSAGSSTNESGPSTPLRTYGYSPTLSQPGSFDHSPQIVCGDLSRRPSIDPAKELAPPPIIVEPPTQPTPPAHPTEARISRSSSTMSLREFIPSRPVKQEAYNNLPPERNSVDVERIEAGLDTRTTVMLKNVPNKMSDADLRKYISDVVPNSFDFVYLRFDFSSSANVGYAFVNFIEVSDLLTFAKARLGVKWNMFCSEKVLQMSYANFQGKEALVEKFRNSCVMEMQDEWVPKIFYSSGPLKGQREPFPPATNPSRARRSQDQRERGLLRTTNPYVAAGRHFHYKSHHPGNHQDYTTKN